MNVLRTTLGAFLLLTLLFSCNKEHKRGDVEEERLIEKSVEDSVEEKEEPSLENIFKPGWITSELGLTLRSEPALSGAKLVVMPFGENVWIINGLNEEVVINGVKGRWVKIRWRDRYQGWAFDGFISTDRLSIEIVEEDVLEQFFTEIRELANFNPYSNVEEPYFIAPELFSTPDSMEIHSYTFKDNYSYIIEPYDFFRQPLEIRAAKDNYGRYHLYEESLEDGTIFSLNKEAGLLVAATYGEQLILRPGVKLLSPTGLPVKSSRLFESFALLRSAVLSNNSNIVNFESGSPLYSDYGTGRIYESYEQFKEGLKSLFDRETMDALYKIGPHNLRQDEKQLIWHFEEQKKLISITYSPHIPRLIGPEESRFGYFSDEDMSFLEEFYKQDGAGLALKAERMAEDERLLQFFSKRPVLTVSFGSYETLPWAID